MLQIKTDFPIFNHHPDLIYLDNAATTQKPQIVIDRLSRYYTEANANVHRGIYKLAESATQDFENARESVKKFIEAKSTSEIIFTSGATEAINLVAHSYLSTKLKAGDAVAITVMEHHSNLLPWQILAKAKGAKLIVIPITKTGALDLDELSNLLTEDVRFMAFPHISNTLGTKNPIKEIITLCQKRGITTLVDAAQSALSEEIKVEELGCDFLVFSGHKVLAPMGIGVLYAKATHHQDMLPYQYGGEMIESVSFQESSFAAAPYKFEAGTPNVGGALALESALQYIDQIGKAAIRSHLQELKVYAEEQLLNIKGLEIIGTARDKTAIFSLHMPHIHPHDLATILNQAGVAVRAGHHCTEPLMEYLELPGTCRASFGIYNSKSDVDRLVDALHTSNKIFS